jgi:hypothetical protein
MSIIINNLQSYSAMDYRRSGVYTVGNMNFVNKADALIYATSTNQEVTWEFNPDVFGAIDWTVPIETSLPELYRQRAQQLRDKYDYLSLFYSGGVDSTNILQTFITNNIFLDEIVMYRPARIINEANTVNRQPYNIYSEIEFAAVPYLQKYMRDYRTKIRFIDVDTSLEKFFQDPDLPTCFANIHQYSAQQVGKIAVNVTDQFWNDLYACDVKVCHILGQDKPFVYYDNDQFGCDFYDDTLNTMIYANESFSAKYSDIINNQFHECFYWTPDLPQIVIKQCQMIKSAAQQDAAAFARFFPDLTKKTRADKDEVIKTIYPENVQEVRSMFATEKGPRCLTSPLEVWFYRTMGDQIVGQFKDMINFSTSNIADKFFRKNTLIDLKLSYQYYHGTRYYF